MRRVIDANILVAELVRRRGRALITHPLLDLAAAEHAWSEAQPGALTNAAETCAIVRSHCSRD